MSKFKLYGTACAVIIIVAGGAYFLVGSKSLSVILPVMTGALAGMSFVSFSGAKKEGGSLGAYIPAICMLILAVCVAVCTVMYYVTV